MTKFIVCVCVCVCVCVFSHVHWWSDLGFEIVEPAYIQAIGAHLRSSDLEFRKKLPMIQ